ncbi:P1 family peptidase [Aggregatilinea lenta]|uniref:P1 family peptidase n=1 Tax=Aggregatilinea lenta TaxID=913108 RepID=UPI000E5B8261|nr:P1 family peptidase [Aggregatilinea lenta]
MENSTITAIEGIRVGHAHNVNGPTGCTVILCPPGTVGGVDQRGGAPGTRETDLLRPGHLVQHVNAILLAGGSAYGLGAAGGVMRYLEAQGQGQPTPAGVVPIVPAAILYDLDLGDAQIRPDAAMGYAACEAASTGPVAEGCVGAGTGARVGTMLGLSYACKSGIGSAMIETESGIKVGALVAVNAVGDVLDERGAILAGARVPPDGVGFADSMALLRAAITMNPASAGNTVIGVVATNAALNKEEINKVAQMAHDGLARAVRPAHTLFDGDTLFALATGSGGWANVSAVGALAADAVAAAIRRAVRAATSLAGLPAIRDLGANDQG